MSDNHPIYKGGCLCGALRFAARAEPVYAGHCYCTDCQKASGSGFIPFMGFAADSIEITGDTAISVSRSARGGDATRNVCAHCHSLVFGGERGLSQTYTIYAGTLDNPSQFKPRIAIFARSRPPWASLPEGVKVFEGMPG